MCAEHRIRMGATNGKPGLAKEDIINFVKITGMNEDQVEMFFVRINEGVTHRSSSHFKYDLDQGNL